MRTSLAIALLVLAPAAHAEPSAMPDWIAGSWLACSDGEEVAELWTGAGSSLIVGVNRTRSARGDSFEFLRIVRDAGGAITLLASPQGAAPTPFSLIENTGQRVTFENPSHDFPQRVIYERRGRALHARIEGRMNGREESMSWRFRAASPTARCR